jgi:hypothetical protein
MCTVHFITGPTSRAHGVGIFLTLTVHSDATAPTSRVYCVWIFLTRTVHSDATAMLQRCTAMLQRTRARTTHSTQPCHGTSPTHHHSIPTTTTITTTTITTAPLSCAGVWQYMQKVCTQFRHAHPTHGISCGMQNSGQWVCVPIDQNRDILIQNTI